MKRADGGANIKTVHLDIRTGVASGAAGAAPQYPIEEIRKRLIAASAALSRMGYALDDMPRRQPRERLRAMQAPAALAVDEALLMILDAEKP